MVVFGFGARMHYAVPHILMRQGLLSKFYTDWPRKSMPRDLRNVTRSLPITLVFWPLLTVFKSEKSGLEEAVNIVRSLLGQLLILLYCDRSETIYTFNSNAFLLLYFNRDVILEATIAPKKTESRMLLKSSTNLFKEIYARLEIYEYKKARKVIAPSNFVKREINAIDSKIKVSICEYGVSQSYWHIAANTKRSTRKAVFVGKFGFRKGADIVVSLAKTNPHWHFVVAGELAYPSKVPLNLILLGKCSKDTVRELYQTSTCLVLPSRCEGSATVFYEAGLCGLPCIGSMESGIPLLVKNNLELNFNGDINLDRLNDQFEVVREENPFELSLEAYSIRLQNVINS